MACDCHECDDCEERAERLAQRFLYRHLTRTQRRCLKENEYFVVKGNVTGTKYHVYFNGDDSVFSVDDDGDFESHYCLDVRDEHRRDVPEGDRVLARKLLIQSDESTFLKVANRTQQ